MALAAGTRLGPYEIGVRIGMGGMGEVYRATDTSLGRDVAIKVLPAAFAQDPERLARFEREAKTLASLNHPSIAAVYQLERSSATTALVMELVEGPTLSDRIAEGPLSVDEALAIANQVSEALEAAHEQGIIHRDLKPANIKVRDDGTVKVLDFGLAKLIERGPAEAGPSLPDSPTITSPALVTGVGVLLGTAAYMSPEQAKGKAADRRSDLWAFGCVLFEMLTGTRAFAGEDIAEIFAAIVRAEPDWTKLPSSTPPGVRTLLHRALQKDRALRLRDAGDARLELQDASSSRAIGSPAPWRRPVWHIAAAVAAAAALVVVAFIVGSRWRAADPAASTSAPLMRLSLALPPGAELVPTPPAISPDGTRVAYAAVRGGVQQLYVHALRNPEARVLSGTEGATSPFFSPDGNRLGFIASGKLKVVSISGGLPLTLHDAANQVGAWITPDTLLFRGPETGILTISANGGTASTVVPNAAESAEALLLGHPDILPDGKSILFSSSNFDALTANDKVIEVVSLDTGAHKTIISGGSYGRYLPTGHVIFLRSGTLLAAPFDLARLQAGAPVEVLDDIRESVIGVGSISCSRTGSCVYATGGLDGARRTVVLVDRAGNAELLPLAPQSYYAPRFSPDGQKVSFWIQRNRCDVLVYDLSRGVSNRLTLDGDSHLPIWGPPGQIIYVANRATTRTEYELFSKSADGSGAEKRLTADRLKLGAVSPLAWSPTAGVLAFAHGGDIWLLTSSGDRKPRRFFESRYDETTPAFSPNGKWLAYVSDDAGRQQVHVRSFPTPGEKIVISTEGGTEPVWSRNGRELYFRSGDRMMVVSIISESPFTTSNPTVLFVRPTRTRSVNVAPFNSYDVSADGRFVMIDEDIPPDSTTHLNVVLNWFDELKRLVPRN